jgi:hypothetical protein
MATQVHQLDRTLQRRTMPLKNRWYTASPILLALRSRSPDLERSSGQRSTLCRDCRLYAQACKTASYQTSWEVQEWLNPGLAIRVPT